MGKGGGGQEGQRDGGGRDKMRGRDKVRERKKKDAWGKGGLRMSERWIGLFTLIQLFHTYSLKKLFQY